MKYFMLYLAVGLVLIAQSEIRGWKYNPIRSLEDVLVRVGVLLLWPIVVGTELVEVYRQWQYKRKNKG